MTLLLAGIVLTLVEILKRTFGITSRYIPIVSIGVMILIMLAAWIYAGFPKIPLETIGTNLVAVLTAMGLYSGTKATLGK